mgnify:CR=1 FL=1
MLDAKVKELINAQINEEFFSEYLYLSFANYFYDNGLDALPTGTISRLRKNMITLC